MSRFLWPIRVYWEDTDAGGIVYYASYLRFLERARTEWLRERGVSQQALARVENVLFTVVSLQAHYHRPARLDDRLLVSCETRQDGGASIAFEQQIWRQTATARQTGEGLQTTAAPTVSAGQDELLLTASVRAACLDARSMKPRRLPPVILRGLSERGPIAGPAAAAGMGSGTVP